MNRHALVLVAGLVAGLVLPAAARAADPDRGRALYELRCSGCHSESVHGRVKRVATDLDAVRAWVSRWNGSLGLRWTEDETDDVVVYLNNAYYRYPCPPRFCKIISLAPPAAPGDRVSPGRQAIRRHRPASIVP